MEKRVIIVILDGLSDLPCKELNNKTPLEAATKPCLNFLANYGKTGILYPIRKGIAPESDQSMLSLLNFNPEKYYTGRGILEAYGSDIKIKPNHIYIRINFSKVENGIIKKVQGTSLKQIKSYIKKLNKIEKRIKIMPTIGYRAVLVLNTKSSPRISNTHPGYKIRKNFATQALKITGKKLKEKELRALTASASETVKILNDFIAKSRNILKNKTMLLRGAGNKLPKLKHIPNFTLIADMPVEIAIGKLTKMKIIKKPKDLERLASIIIKEKNNIYVQIKGPDTYGHLGLPLKKKREIEKIDKEFFKPLLKSINLNNNIILVTSDHSTPCSYKSHSFHPCPILLFGKDRDNVKEFSESECKKGSLKVIQGNLLKFIK